MRVACPVFPRTYRRQSGRDLLWLERPTVPCIIGVCSLHAVSSTISTINRFGSQYVNRPDIRHRTSSIGQFPQLMGASGQALLHIFLIQSAIRRIRKSLYPSRGVGDRYQGGAAFRNARNRRGIRFQNKSPGIFFEFLIGYIPRFGGRTRNHTLEDYLASAIKIVAHCGAIRLIRIGLLRPNIKRRAGLALRRVDKSIRIRPAVSPHLGNFLIPVVCVLCLCIPIQSRHRGCIRIKDAVFPHLPVADRGNDMSQ